MEVTAAVCSVHVKGMWLCLNKDLFRKLDFVSIPWFVDPGLEGGYVYGYYRYACA